MHAYTAEGWESFFVAGAGAAAALPVVVAGISLWVGTGGRLYWLAAGLLLLLVNGIANAWVLLVEILR